MANILIVDDALTIRNILKKMLLEAGHTIVGEAARGDDAVQAYKELQPELVIMDVTMPGMDGIEASRQMLAHNENAKIIICSSVSTQKTVMLALQAGVKDFITKPITSSRVLQAIKQVLHQ